MPLTAGTRLGPYEITALIGAGGMGEVYRARDARLQRDVAIKILPEALAGDPDRLARFEREAQVLAALTHPNIGAIHGLEELADGGRALVLELVEGDTLEDRIARGPLAVDEALAIARQIVEALEAAHDAGVVHRDLKPANIKITPAGHVKVLDFGLAKMREPAASAPATTQAPTITTPAMMTGVGMILGTAAYMSPEQARGKAVDRRADIWAFGCVLYEMLTGQRAFADEDVSLTLSKVLQREPDFAALPADAPASARHILRLCLKKDVRERIQAIGDVRLALTGGLHDTAPGQNAATDTTRRQRPLAIAAAAWLLGATLAGAAAWVALRPSPRLPVRTEIVTSRGAAFSIQGLDRDLAITPDGSRIVYRGADGLFVRALSELEPMPLGRVEEPRSIFMSPDGQWVGFFAGGSLYRIAISGGAPVVMTSVGIYTPRGATWGPDGTVVFATSAGGTGLQRVSSAGGGDATVLTKPDGKRNESGHVWPEFLPGGDAVLFTIVRAGMASGGEIAVLDLNTGTHKVVLSGGSHAHYVPSGHLIYGEAGTLRAVRFDLMRRAVVGTPVPVVEGVVMTAGGAMDAAVAADGTLVYAGGVLSSGERRLVWVDRQGTVEPVRNIEPNAYRNLRLSPDGRSVALLFEGDVWIHEIDTGRRTRLTRDQSVTTPVAWDPTGSRVAYSATREGSHNAWVHSLDGSSEPRQLTQLGGIVDVDWWSPDGHVLSVHHHRPDGGISMLMLPMENRSAPPDVFVENEAWAEGATFSPDGRYVAYTSSDTGRREVYIRAYPRSGGSTPVSVGGGREVLWARTGELFYRNEAGDRMMGLTVATQPTLRVGNPKEVFAGRFGVNLGGSPRPIYDVTRDGRRFMMLQDTGEVEQLSQPRLIVVQNFLEELKRLLPSN